jgi:uncharacterized repeat protein (TIGR01451 family)
MNRTHEKEKAMKLQFKKYAVTVCILLFPLSAFADLTLNVKAEKEIAVVKNGKSELKRVKAKNFEPGDTIFYTISYKNTGTEVVTNAIIDDPVPKNTSYVQDSASGANADITFSIDNGKNYKKPLMLSYELKGKSGEIRQAKPEEYTNIRWTVSKVQPGGSGQVEFRVKVK